MPDGRANRRRTGVREAIILPDFFSVQKATRWAECCPEQRPGWASGALCFPGRFGLGFPAGLRDGYRTRSRAGVLRAGRWVVFAGGCSVRRCFSGQGALVGGVSFGVAHLEETPRRGGTEGGGAYGVVVLAGRHQWK